MSKLIKHIAEINGFGHAVPMLIDLYNEPHRKYHNIEHIEDLITVAMGEGYADQHPIMKAILYHDLIYYPCCKYNEDLSADVFWSHKLSPEKPHDVEVYDSIRSSKNHCATGNVFLNNWGKDFLDFDLMGLAGEHYRSNGIKIWYEYKPFVSVFDFVDGRKKFLKNMLSVPEIYWNHPQWEGQARANMAGELDELERGYYRFIDG